MGMGITVRFVLEQLIPSWFNSVILKKVISIAVAAAEKEVLSENHSTHTDAPSATTRGTLKSKHKWKFTSH